MTATSGKLPVHGVLSRLKKVRQAGADHWQACCPAHDDKTPSLSIAQGEDGRVLLKCFAGCGVPHICEALGIQERDLFSRTVGSNAVPHTGDPRILLARIRGWRPCAMLCLGAEASGGEVLFPMCDAEGSVTGRKRRRGDNTTFRNGGKSITQAGGHNGLFYARPLPSEDDVLICEGEADTCAALSAGHVATVGTAGANPGGKVLAYLQRLAAGRDVVVAPDADAAGRMWRDIVGRALSNAGCRVRFIIPSADGAKDLDDRLRKMDENERPAALKSLMAGAISWTDTGSGEAKHTTSAEPKTRKQVSEIFRKWLYLPDDPSIGALYVSLAAAIANRLEGDAVWLLLVGAPGSGKTEMLSSLVGLPDVYSVSTLTEGSLLSGTSQREKAKDAKGGLLRQVGDFGILVLKDFGSALSLNRDSRGQILQGLREIYDGSWTRHVGTDGGRVLHWRGKVGIVGGSTAAIDSFHSVMASLGERFVFYRIPKGTPSETAGKALTHLGREAAMRGELGEAVRGLMSGVTIPGAVSIGEREKSWLVGLATLTAQCRAATVRDGYRREVELIPGAESPMRLSLVLAKLAISLEVLGVERKARYALILKVGLDSMPDIRRRLVEFLGDPNLEDVWQKTSDTAEALSVPTQTARRALEDLTCYHVCEREAGGEGRADKWRLSEEAARLYYAALSLPGEA